MTADARAALRMIREVVEQNAPPGTIPPEERVEFDEGTEPGERCTVIIGYELHLKRAALVVMAGVRAAHVFAHDPVGRPADQVPEQTLLLVLGGRWDPTRAMNEGCVG